LWFPIICKYGTFHVGNLREAKKRPSATGADLPPEVMSGAGLLDVIRVTAAYSDPLPLVTRAGIERNLRHCIANTVR
jgi:hypothetical protein